MIRRTLEAPVGAGERMTWSSEDDDDNPNRLKRRQPSRNGPPSRANRTKQQRVQGRNGGGACVDCKRAAKNPARRLNVQALECAWLCLVFVLKTHVFSRQRGTPLLYAPLVAPLCAPAATRRCNPWPSLAKSTNKAAQPSSSRCSGLLRGVPKSSIERDVLQAVSTRAGIRSGTGFATPFHKSRDPRRLWTRPVLGAVRASKARALRRQGDGPVRLPFNAIDIVIKDVPGVYSLNVGVLPLTWLPLTNVQRAVGSLWRPTIDALFRRINVFPTHYSRTVNTTSVVMDMTLYCSKDSLNTKR